MGESLNKINHYIAAEICMDHIKNEVWYLLGFLLQQRVHESKFVDVAGGCQMNLTNYYERIIREFFIFDNTRMIITDKNIKFMTADSKYIELSTMLLIYEEEGKIGTFLNILMEIWVQYEEELQELPVADVIHDVL